MANSHDFSVTFTSRHEEANEQFKETAISEVLKLSKYHNHIINGDITIDRQNLNVKAEVLIHIPGRTLRACDEDYNAAKAFDSALDKAKIQLKKLKSRIIDHRGQAQPAIQEFVESDVSEDVE